MLAFYIVAAAYLLVAGFVTMLSWRTPMRHIGIALMACSVVSGIGVLTMPFPARVALEITLAVLITITTFDVWLRTHTRYAEPIILLAVIDTCFSGVICVLHSDTYRDVHLFDMATNAIFAAQCGFVGWPGARDAVLRLVDHWSGAINRRSVFNDGGRSMDEHGPASAARIV